VAANGPHTPEFADPPLIEAVFDLFVEPSLDVDSKLADRFFEALPSYSGDVETLHNIGMTMEVKEGRPASQSMHSQETGTRRWNAKRSRAVMFSPDILAFNVLHQADDPYGHFEDHVDHLKMLLERFYEIARPKRILWAGHRYINHVPIDLAEATTGADLFKLYPALPAEHAKTHPHMAVQVEAGRFPGGAVVANLSLAMKNIKVAVYSLDVYAKTDGAPPSPLDGLMSWHTAAHEAVVEVFLSSLTDVAKKRFKENA
jgi:uncharacterized protein (TIGR04255 family)